MHEPLLRIERPNEESLTQPVPTVRQAGWQDRTISLHGYDLCRDEKTIRRIAALALVALFQVSWKIQMSACMGTE